VRAGGGDEEEPERDAAAGMEVLPQRIGGVGPPDRPRHPHDRGATVHAHLVVTVAAAVAVTIMVVHVVVVAADVADMAAVRAGGEEQGATHEEERLPRCRGEGWFERR
jgi:hypothetical protein